MFGYVVADLEHLTEEQKTFYRSYYCGLCHTLQKHYGLRGQLTLSYDMTFLILLLTGLYGAVDTEKSGRCVPHPVHKHPYRINEFTAYAADMNLLLMSQKLRDDCSDEGNPFAGFAADRLKKYTDVLGTRYPRQQKAIADGLRDLHLLETSGDLNPDAASEAFGRLTEEIFVVREDEYAVALRTVGMKLGQFIYLADADTDRIRDLKKERYNPLVALPVGDMETILTVLMSECTDAYQELSLPDPYDSVLKNILYAGVWTRYRYEKQRAEKRGNV